MSAPILSQGVGYAVVLGIGLFFSALMIGLTTLQNRYTSYKQSSAVEFTSASHSVKPGLIASGIVSAWTWAATLLQSSAIAYKFGVSGPWWYAAGATVQILLFAQNAAKLKMNAPGAHTFLEVISKRWGTFAHFTFMFFGLATNIIVSSMLITGGSDTVTNLTGMPTPAACMLIPVGVVIYVLIGGMRASLLADYIHTSALFSIILAFMMVVYATSDKIGSPGAMYDMLVAASELNPVPGNAGGSYLTFRSKSGLIFGVINVIGNFATVFCDQSYWQRAIASQPVSCVKAFLLAGSSWLSVPLGLASTLGLAAIVLTTNPSFPNFPHPLSASEVGAGLPAPAAASTLLGASGAVLMLVLLFLAVTSAASAELVAVSSIATYDIYLPYINPSATESQILAVDKIAIVVYGVVMGVLGVIFFYVGISMGWLYEFMGVVLGSAVCPIAMAIMSERANKWACISGAWGGLIAGVVAWLATTSALNNGSITINTTFGDYEMLAGNLAAIGVGAIISVGGSYIWPENYDFAETRAIGEHDFDFTGESMAPETPSRSEKDDEKKINQDNSGLASATASILQPYDENKDPVKLQKAYDIAVKASLVLFVVLILLIPLPLFFSSYIWTKAGFTTYIVVCFIWVFYGAFVCVLYPIFESRAAIGEISGAVIRDIFGGGQRTVTSEAA